MLDVSVLGKAVPFFHCYMDGPVLRLPPENLMLEKNLLQPNNPTHLSVRRGKKAAKHFGMSARQLS